MKWYLYQDEPLHWIGGSTVGGAVVSIRRDCAGNLYLQLNGQEIAVAGGTWCPGDLYENLIKEWLDKAIDVEVEFVDKAHILKIASTYFSSVKDDSKPFEVRYNDRNYKVGDWLLLREVNDLGAFTRFSIMRQVTYILDDPAYCKEGYVILGLGGDKK
jgi:hypothetical protein